MTEFPFGWAFLQFEILEKSEERLPHSETDGITQSYNALRYGEREAEPEKLNLLVQTLKRMERAAYPNEKSVSDSRQVRKGKYKDEND